MWIHNYSSAGGKEIGCEVSSAWNWEKLPDGAREYCLTNATAPETGRLTSLVFFDQEEISQLFRLGYFNGQPNLSFPDLASIVKVETVCVTQKLEISSQPVALIKFHGYTKKDKENSVLLGTCSAAQLRQTVEQLWIKTQAHALS